MHLALSCRQVGSPIIGEVRVLQYCFLNLYTSTTSIPLNNLSLLSMFNRSQYKFFSHLRPSIYISSPQHNAPPLSLSLYRQDLSLSLDEPRHNLSGSHAASQLQQPTHPPTNNRDSHFYLMHALFLSHWQVGTRRQAHAPTYLLFLKVFYDAGSVLLHRPLIFFLFVVFSCLKIGKIVGELLCVCERDEPRQNNMMAVASRSFFESGVLFFFFFRTRTFYEN